MTNPDSKFYIPVEQRRELIESEVTLNGQKAKVTGCKNDFATVCQLPDGMRVEFSWWTVKHVINNSDGKFNA